MQDIRELLQIHGCKFFVTVLCTLADTKGSFALVQMRNVVSLLLCPAAVGTKEGEQWVVWSSYTEVLVLLQCPSVEQLTVSISIFLQFLCHY